MTPNVPKLAILGAGAMGGAFVEGLVSAGWDPGQIIAAARSAGRRQELHQRFGVVMTADVGEALASARIALLVVKPQDVSNVLPHIAGAPHLDLLVSVCAGIPLSLLEARLPEMPIVRIMPNTPVQVRAGAIALAAGRYATEEHLSTVEALLAGVGTVVRVPEKLFDAVTALSGTGPAYVFMLAEAMIEAGVSLGIPRTVADPLVRSVLLGASSMLGQGGLPPSELRHAVTSPAGTTTAALRVMEAQGFRSMMYDALHAAAERSGQLGREVEGALGHDSAEPIPTSD